MSSVVNVRSPVNSPHKGQWRGGFMFSLICAWINRWVNNREAGDLRRYRTHYDVIVIIWENSVTPCVFMLAAGIAPNRSIKCESNRVLNRSIKCESNRVPTIPLWVKEGPQCLSMYITTPVESTTVMGMVSVHHGAKGQLYDVTGTLIRWRHDIEKAFCMTDPFSGEAAGHPWIPFTKETLLWGLYTLLLTRSISYMNGDWRWHNAYVTSLYVDKRGFCRPQSLHFLHEIREYHTVYTIYISLRWNAQPSLQWRHNEHDGASNHQPRDCLLNRLFRCRSKETSKLRVTGLFVRGIHRSPVNFPHKEPVTRKMFPFGDVIMHTRRTEYSQFS